MAKKEIKIIFDEIPKKEILDARAQLGIAAAVDLLNTAYAPYSRFRVGAIAELADGTLIKGNNQENIAYPSGLCAERVALFAAAAQHPNQAVTRLYITASDQGKLLESPAYPCGACRQVMVDIENRQGAQMEVWMAGTETVIKVGSASDLLPLKFEWIGPQDPA